MKEYAEPFGGALRRAAVRGALAVAAVSALALVGLLSPGGTEGSGAFDVDGTVTKIQVYYDGTCDPGTLQGSIPATGGIGLIVALSGDVFGCLASEAAPSVVLIDQELLAYSNVNTVTTNAISASAQPPFALQVSSTSGFPSSGQIYVSSELMSYGSKTANSFNISARAQGTTGKQTHLIGSFVRAQGKLKVVGRGQPRYAEGGSEANTQPASHAPGATVTSPKTYLTCRGRMEQTAQPGPDTVSSRSRCYAILEPGYNPPSEPFWPDPYPGPLLALSPEFYHDHSVGGIEDGATGPFADLWLTTQYLGFQCFPYVEGALWIKMETDIQVDKFPLNEDEGDFNIYVYDNANCEAPHVAVMGGTENFSSTAIAAATDTDLDGCPDWDELGSEKADGGLRDPFNEWDYFNPTGDGQNRVDDILKVVGQYFKDLGNPQYMEETDRTALPQLPPLCATCAPRSAPPWTFGAPNGQQRVDDILGAVRSYFHDCG